MGVAIIDSVWAEDGFAAGTAARGDFNCTGCGYGVTIRRTLPACPMCQGAEWRPATRRRTADPGGVVDTRA